MAWGLGPCPSPSPAQHNPQQGRSRERWGGVQRGRAMPRRQEGAADNVLLQRDQGLGLDFRVQALRVEVSGRRPHGSGSRPDGSVYRTQWASTPSAPSGPPAWSGSRAPFRRHHYHRINCTGGTGPLAHHDPTPPPVTSDPPDTSVGAALRAVPLQPKALSPSGGNLSHFKCE